MAGGAASVRVVREPSSIAVVPSTQIGVAKISAAQPIGPITSTIATRIISHAHHLGSSREPSTAIAPARNTRMSAISAPTKNPSERR